MRVDINELKKRFILYLAKREEGVRTCRWKKKKRSKKVEEEEGPNGETQEKPKEHLRHGTELHLLLYETLFRQLNFQVMDFSQPLFLISIIN